MIRVKADKINSLIREIFKKLEVDDLITDYAARGILHTSLRGVDTHGLRLLHHYVQGIKEGRINKKPNIKFISNSMATSIMDADHSLGYSAGMIAMEKAIKIANEAGIAAVSVKNSSHCGALSYYCEEAANNDMIGIAFTHATSKLKTPNSTKEFFGTNPICFCAPMENNLSVCFDSAQSFISFHEVLDSRVENRKLKNNIAADEHGNITDNPNEATLTGIEVEGRKSLGFLHDSLRDFSLGGNFTYIEGEVDRFPIEIAAKTRPANPRPIEETRALTNQPEYIANADLTYDNPDWGLRVSLIAYRISEVLQGVSFVDSYDVYGNAYTSLDLTASKTIKEDLKVSFSIKNITDSERGTYYDVEGDDVDRDTYKVGQSMSLGINYEF